MIYKQKKTIADWWDWTIQYE